MVIYQGFHLWWSGKSQKFAGAFGAGMYHALLNSALLGLQTGISCAGAFGAGTQDFPTILPPKGSGKQKAPPCVGYLLRLGNGVSQL